MSKHRPNKRHPFGKLVDYHLKQGDLTKMQLADGINVDPSVITRMCQGQRLTDRRRILDIIRWFNKQDVLSYEAEATALLEAAHHARLNATIPNELGFTLPKQSNPTKSIKLSFSNEWAGLVDVDPRGLAIIEGYDLWFSCKATGRWQIWRLDSNSGLTQPVQFEMDRVTTQLDQFVPAISPDRRKIAFAAGDSDRPARNIYLANIDGSDVQKLTNAPYDSYHPTWSPDGQKLVYSAERPADTKGARLEYGIWVIDLKQGTHQQLTSDWGYDPVWSPQGNHIAYHAMKPVWHIRILNYKARISGKKRDISWMAANEGDYTTSPGWINNYKIVFSARVNDRWHLYQLPVKAHHPYKNPTQLTYNQWDNVYPAVFDGRILVWQAFRHEVEGDEGQATDRDALIYVMDLYTREAVPLITGVGNARDGCLSWSVTSL